MLLLSLNIFYVLLAIAMIALILMQRGSGAQAGAGFGGGASGTVFGARGASNFLSKATKWMAIVFFAISMYMAWRATDLASMGVEVGPDLGVMSQMPAVPVEQDNADNDDVAVPAAPAPPAPATQVPQAPTGEATGEPAQSPPPDAAGD